MSTASRTAVLRHEIAGVPESGAFNSLDSQKGEFMLDVEFNFYSFVKGVPKPSCYTSLYPLNFVFQYAVV